MNYLESFILYFVAGAAMIFSVVNAKHSKSSQFPEPRRRVWFNLVAAILSAGVMLLVTQMVAGRLHCVSRLACWLAIAAVTGLAIEQGRRAIWQTHKFKEHQRAIRRQVPQFLYKH